MAMGSWRMETTVRARTQLKLFTGGKGRIGRQDLLCINAWAETYGKPPRPNPGMPWLDTPSTPVPPQQIQIRGKALGNDGKLWFVLPDNFNTNLNLIAPGRHYGAWAYAEKYRAYITANGVPLDPNNVVITNCAGEKVVFTLGIDPMLPAGTAVTNPYWYLPPKYVNAWEEWVPLSRTMGFFIFFCHPENVILSRALETGEIPPAAPYCKRYRMENWPLTQRETGAWWISEGVKLISFYTDLLFANGQKVSLTVRGQLRIHRPKIIDFSTRNSFRVSIGYEEGTPLLQLGEPYGSDVRNDMEYTVTILSEFSGRADVIQLINASRANGLTSDTTYGQYWLDTCRYYLARDNDSPQVSVKAGMPAEILFSDGPAFPCRTGPGGNTTSVVDYFTDYLIFKPSSDNSIPVTLGTNTWSWSASTTLMDGQWSTPTGYVPPPRPFEESDEFPVWTRVYR